MIYMEVSQCDIIRKLDKSAMYITIPSGSCNDASRLDLSGYTQLKSIVVYYNAFKNCKTVVLKSKLLNKY